MFVILHDLAPSMRRAVDFKVRFDNNSCFRVASLNCRRGQIPLQVQCRLRCSAFRLFNNAYCFESVQIREVCAQLSSHSIWSVLFFVFECDSDRLGLHCRGFCRVKLLLTWSFQAFNGAHLFYRDNALGACYVIDIMVDRPLWPAKFPVYNSFSP